MATWIWPEGTWVGKTLFIAKIQTNSTIEELSAYFKILKNQKTGDFLSGFFGGSHSISKLTY